jgi:DNA-binding transcriptional LysR family regulator
MADISLLQTFIELSRTRHFGKTAQSLFLTQSAVSARIKILEDTLGVKLVSRDRNNIQLTPAGSRLLPFAENITNTWNRARQEVGLENDNMVLLTMGAVPSLWDTSLQNLVGHMRATLPNVVLNIEAHHTSNLIRFILEDVLDLAFMFEAPDRPELASSSIGHIVLTLISTHVDQAASKIVAQPDYLLLDWGVSFKTEHARMFPDLTPPMIRISYARLALNYLLKQGGSAYLPLSMVQDLLESGQLHRVNNAPQIQREVFAAYSHKCTRRELVEDVIKASRFGDVIAESIT